MKTTSTWSAVHSGLLKRLINGTLVLIVALGMVPYAAIALEDDLVTLDGNEAIALDDLSADTQKSWVESGLSDSEDSVISYASESENETGLEGDQGNALSADYNTGESKNDDEESTEIDDIVSGSENTIGAEDLGHDGSEADVEITALDDEIEPLAITRNVSTLAELNQAINEVPANDSEGTSTITLTADISGSITIPASKNITLNGNAAGRKLTGINGSPTVAVTNGGRFHLGNNLTLTHPANSSGRSIGVANYGTFILAGGTITGNSTVSDLTPPSMSYGGGVYCLGTFTMNSGTISSNTAAHGAGVYVDGTFTMNGGTISSNTTPGSGGGVYLRPDSTFTMSGGEITGNQSNSTLDGGGGIMLDAKTTGVIKSGAKITNNTAANNGGGIWITNTNTDLSKLTVEAGAVFSGNTAKSVYSRAPSDDATYNTYILGTQWSVGGQGYNNYDISYVYSSPVVTRTVTFNGNGGTPASQTVSVTNGSSVGSNNMPSVSRSGFTFVGWYDTSASTGGTQFTATTAVSANRTVYARWGYTVTVDGNGSANSSGGGSYVQGVSVSINAGTYSGRRFSGWTVNSGGVTLANSSNAATTFTMPAANVTVTANWVQQYTVTFNGNGGGTPSPSTIDVDTGTSVGSLPTVSRSGYVFMNWWDTSALTGGTQFLATTAVTANRTVYARWGHAVTVISTGSTGSSGGGHYIEGASVSINAGTRAGYVFSNWTTAASGVTFANATSVTTTFTMPTTDVTVTANWTQTFTVTFNGNGNSASDQTKMVNSGSTLGSNMPADATWTNYAFMGWYTVSAASGGTQFTSATTVSANITVYARWGRTVSITDNGGTGSTGAGNYMVGDTVSVFSGTRAGHRFDYWVVSAGGATLSNANNATTTFTMPDANVTVRPEWQAQFVVTFNSNGGTTPNPATVIVDTGGTVATLPTVTRSGFVFIGWFTVSTTTGGTQFTSSTSVSAAITIYARWGHTLTVDGDGSSGSSGSGNYVETSSVSINAGTRAGYRFTQWTFTLGSATLGSTTSASTTLTMPTADVTVKANWVQQFTITFDGNGGSTPSPASATVDTGTVIAMLPTTLRTGYVFDGWYTVAATTGGTRFTNTTAVTSSYIVYARWTRTLIVNDSFGSPTGAGDYVPGAIVTIDAGTKNGYRFNCWVVTVGTITLSNIGDAQISFTMPDENLTLTATWQGTNTVTFNSQGGSPASYARTTDTGTNLGTNMPADPARTGYIFMGWWDTTNSTGGTAFNSSTLVSVDRTVYARWGHSVVVDGNGSTGSTGDGTYVGGSSVSINAGIKAGYRFDTWSIVTGSPTLVNASSAITSFTMPATDTELRAEWVEQTTVTFSGNGGSPATQTSTVDKNATVSSLPTVTNSGFVFIGWFTVAASTGGTQFNNVTPVSTNITVYARWGRTVTVLSSQATITGAGDYVDGASVSIDAGTRASYSFAYWSITPLVTYTVGNANSPNPTFVMPNADVTATANWTPDVTVTGSFASAGLTGAGSYAAGTTVTIDAGTRSGFAFNGWTVNPTVVFTSGSASTVTASFTMPAVPVHASASWDNLFDMYVADSYAATSGAGEYITGSTVTLDAGTRAGFTFIAWVITPTVSFVSGSLSSVSPAITMPSSDVYATANWIPNLTITDSYASNTGAGSFPAGTVVTIDAGNRPGHVFSGWTISPAVSFTNGNASSVSASFAMPNVPVSATANWDVLFIVTINQSYASNSGAGNYVSGASVNINAGILAGYRFDRWTVTSGNLTLGSTSANSVATSFIMPAANVILEAGWVKTYSVCFDANGGYVATRNVITYTVDTGSPLGAIMPGTIIKPAYVFMGWFDTINTIGGQEYLGSMVVTSDIDAYARWGHTVTVLNSFASITGAADYVETDTVTISAGVNLGYRFDRWIVDVGTISIQNATSTSTTFSMPVSDVTVRATWVATSTVSFNGNGGSPANTSVTVDTGTSIGIAGMPSVASSGYVFMGWFDTASLSGGSKFTDTTPVTTNVTVYARWGHTVAVIDSYAGSTAGSGDYAEGLQVTIHAGNRTGYTFAGWSITPAVSFTAGSSSSATASFIMPTSDVSATAIWNANVTVFASYAGVGNTGEGNYAPGATVALDAGTRGGYAFIGWQLTPNTISLANPNATLTTFTMPNVPVTAIATWDGKYQVVLNSMGATGDAGAGEYEVYDPVTIYAGVRPGYTFDQWSINPAVSLVGGSTLFDQTLSFTMPASNVTATAVWHPDVVVIDSQAAINGAGSYAPGSLVTVNAGSRADHQFVYWAVSPTTIILSSNTSASSSFTMPPVPVTLTANWSEIFDVVVIDAHALTTGAGSYIQGNTVLLDAGVKQGYRFNGWTVVQGSITITNAALLTASFVMPAEDVEVVANWDVLYNVTVNDSHAASGSTGAGSYIASDVVIIRAGSQAGFRFDGWTVNPATVTLADPNNPNTSFSMPASNVTVTANWYGTHRVVFDGNGGLIGSSATFSTDIDTGSTLGSVIPTDPSLAAYVFMGWYSAAGSAGGTHYTATTVITSNITAYARWGHTITFEYLDSMTSDLQINVVAGQALGSSNMPVSPNRTGYVFMGWYSTATGGVAFDPSSAVNSHRTVYAQWGRTVTVIGSLAGVQSGAGNYRVGDTVTIDAGVNVGFIFDSWSVTMGTLILSNPANSTTSFVMPDDNLTIAAHWDGLYRVVVQDSSAGTTGAGSYLAGATVTIRAGTKTGYSFAGWSTNQAFLVLGNPYSATTSFTMPATDIEATAHWDALFLVTVLSSYAGAGSSGAGSYAEHSLVTIDAGTRTGYRFGGWTVAQGSAILANPSLVITSFLMPDEAMIVQASWVATNIVIFDGNGGSPTTQAVTVDTGASVASLPSVTNPGNVLIGWYSTGSTTGGSEFTNTTVVSSDRTVYARWGYRVSVSDSYASTSGAGNYVTSSIVSIDAGTRTGFRFDSWSVTSGLVSLVNSALPTTSFTMPASDVSLQANWVATCSVSFNSNGGIPAIQTVNADVGSSLGIKMPIDPVRSGYIFVGWYTGINSGILFDSATIVTANITLYAHWGRTVTVLGSQATSTGAGVYRVGDMVTIDAGANGGYDFAGWVITQGSLSLSSPNFAIISFTMPDSNLLLTANWAILYTLNVSDSYAGAGNTGAGSYTSGTVVAIAAGTRTGYTFSTWTSNAGGSFANAASATTSFTMPPQNTTVTASWTAVSITVSFDRNASQACIGPSFSVMTASYGSPYGTLPTITSYGYRFEGWYTAATGGNQILASTVVTDTSSHTLYAHWQFIGGLAVGNNGAQYTIMATSPVSITQSEAQMAIQDSSKLIGYTNALAAEIATGIPSAIVVTNITALIPVPGAYLINLAVVAEPSTSITVMVIVTATTQPPVIGITHVIVADSAVYLSVNEASIILAGNVSVGLINAAGVQVRAYDKETGAPVTPSGLSVSSTPAFSDIVGNYSVDFTVTSDPTATATVTFVVTDSTVAPVLGTTHVIMADSPVFLSTSEATALLASGLDAGLITKARVRVCVKDTGVFVTGITLTGNALFTAAEGAYLVGFSATADPSATIDVLFVVTDSTLAPVIGDSYIMVGSSPVTLTTAQAQAMVGASLNSNLISAASIRAYNKRTGISVSPLALSVQASPSFNAMEGLYSVRFTVVADAKATMTSNFLVVDGNVFAIGDYYAISASTPVILTTEQSVAIGSNTLLLASAAQVKAFDLVTGSLVLPGAIRVASGSLGASVGSYTVRFEVSADPTACVDVVFIVTSSSTVVGDKYVISANNPVVLSVAQASSMLGVGLDLSLISAAGVAAFDKQSGIAEPPAGIAVISNPAFSSVVGVYKVSFTVVADPKAALTVLFIVTDNNLVAVGDLYVIVATSPVRLSTSAAAGAALLDNGLTAAGVKAFRISDGVAVLPSAIQSSPILSSSVGVQTVHYSVIVDGKASIDVRFLVADNNIVVEGNDFIISATSPVFLTTAEALAIEQSDSGGGPGSGAGTSSAAAANVNLYHKPTGQDVTWQLATSGVFSAATDSCQMSYFAPAEVSTALTVLFIITDDALKDVGDSYALTAASPIILTVNQASALIASGMNAGLIVSARAKSFNLGTGAQDGTVFVINHGGFAAVEGSYLVRIAVAGDANASLDVVFIVSDASIIKEGMNSVISAKSPVILLKSQAATIANNTLMLVSAAGVKAWDKSSGTALLPGSIVVASGSLGTGVGSYLLRFAVLSDSAAFVDVLFVIVLDNGVTGTSHIISADTPVILNVDQAAALFSGNLDANLISAAAVRAFDLATGVEESGISVSGSGLFSAAEGIYTINFAVVSDSSANLNVLFIVVDSGLVVVGDKYVITASSHVVLKLDEASLLLSGNLEHGLLGAANVKAFDKLSGAIVSLNGIIVSSNPAFSAAEGSYVISCTVIADSKATLDVLFIVVDAGLVIEGNAYIITGNSPVFITEAEARAAQSDGGKAAAKVRAWNKSSGGAASVSAANGALGVTAGNYVVTYVVDAESTCALAVEFIVLGGVVVEDGGYLLTACTPVHLSTTLAAAMVDDGQIAASVRAYNKVTGSSMALSAELVGFEAKPYMLGVLSSTVVGSAPGAYLVRYFVNAYPSLTAEVLFVVDDNDLCVVGASHVVTAMSEVRLEAEDAALITDGGLKAGSVVAYGIVDGLSSTVSVLSGAVGTEPGRYVVVYRIEDEPGTVISVTFVVVRDGGGNGGDPGDNGNGNQGGGSGTGGGTRPGTGTTSTGDHMALVTLMLMTGLLALTAITLNRRRQNNL